MQPSLEPFVIKGTRYGLLVSVREDADFDAAMLQLRERLAQESGFLGGASLSVDLGWREVGPQQFAALEQALIQAGVSLQGVLSTSLATRTLAESHGYKAIIGRLGLAEHQGRAIRRCAERAGTPAEVAADAVTEPSASETAAPTAAGVAITVESGVALESASLRRGPADEEPTLFLRKTLRSGQKVIFAGNVVIMGDVNPGAEIEAEGDVVVLGSLRGKAHAGCAGKQQSQVMALVMQPTQLRIGEELWVPESPGKRAKFGPMRAVIQRGKLLTEAM